MEKSQYVNSHFQKRGDPNSARTRGYEKNIFLALSKTSHIRADIRAVKNGVQRMEIEILNLDEFRREVEIMQISMINPSSLYNCTDHIDRSITPFISLLDKRINRLEISEGTLHNLESIIFPEEKNNLEKKWEVELREVTV